MTYACYCLVCNRRVKSRLSDINWLWRLRVFRLQHIKHVIKISGYGNGS